MEMEYKSVDSENSRSRYFWRQLAVCMIAMVIYFLMGLTLGSPTVTVPQLRKEANDTAAVSEAMASWLTSIMSYTATLGVLVLIILLHFFGRKKPMIITVLNSICGYILFYCSKDVLHVFFSQMIQGLTQAAYTTVCCMMVLEYTSSNYRGLFLGFFGATYYWGMWVANIIGTFFNFRYIALVGIICASLNFIAVIAFLPESPFWLACQGRYEECAVNHRWLKGFNEESKKELKDMIDSQKAFKMSLIKSKNSFGSIIKKCKIIIEDPQVYKPLMLSSLTLITYQFSGKLVCAVYALEIMKKITKKESDAYMGILVLDAFSIVGMYAGSFIMNSIKRRVFLIGSCIMNTIFLFAISTLTFLVKTSVVPENVYVSLSFLIGYTLTACGTVMSSATLFSELYPTKYRTAFMCMLCMLSKLILGTSFKLAPFIFKTFYMHGAFLFCGIGLVVSTILVYKYIPETKGKTIQEISELFKNEKVYQKGTKLLEGNTS